MRARARAPHAMLVVPSGVTHAHGASWSQLGAGPKGYMSYSCVPVRMRLQRSIVHRRVLADIFLV